MTMTEEIERLYAEHWEITMALASKAESADDLNIIVHELGKLYEHIHGGYPASFWNVRTKAISLMEDNITQWENITGNEDYTEWELPIMYDNDFSMVFKKDDNTLIMWDDLEGKYIEVKRAGEEVKA